MRQTIDWAAVEVEYLAGVRSVNSLSKHFGCSEAAIRKQAKKNGWIRNPTRVKREKVKSALATSAKKSTNESTNESTKFEQVRTVMAQAVFDDVDDMNLALNNARLLLQKCAEMIPDQEEARDLKIISETNKLNMDVIRRIRGLDDEQGGGYEDDLEALAGDLV